MEPEKWSDWSDDSVIIHLIDGLLQTPEDDFVDVDSHTFMVEQEEHYTELYYSLHDKAGDNPDEQFSSSSDELNLPLAELKQRLWHRNNESNILIAQKVSDTKQTQNKPCYSPSEDPCSFSSISYRPSDPETNSQSDTNDIKKKRKRKGQKSNLKKHGENVKRRKTKNMKQQRKFIDDDSLYHSSENEEISKTKQMSLKESKFKKMLRKFHENKLDKLLSSNLYERKPVPADGNCLFAAVLEFLKNPLTVQELRAAVADHLESNIKDYIDFINFPEDCSDASKQKEIFMKLVHQIKTDGLWDTNMSDLVPLCIANVLHRDIRIFSSRHTQQILDIKQLISPVVDNSPIVVAQLAIRGSEHYDSVTKKSLSEQKGRSHVQGNQVDQVGHQNCQTKAQQKPTKRKETPELHNTTPHKDVIYNTPTKKKLTRKKISMNHLWKSNIRKEARAKGRSYTSKRGHTVKARDVREVDCKSCKFKCSEKVNCEQRRLIFKTYWNLADYSKQRHFIYHHVEEKEPARRKTNSQRTRTFALSYHLTSENVKVRVCKAFFLATLDIGRKCVETVIKKKQSGSCVGRDNRGRHVPPNKTPEADLKFVRDHITSFPTVDPHYTRKDTKRKYLSEDLNIRNMYRYYTEQCKAVNRKPVSEKVYRNTFCTEFNLSFFHPQTNTSANNILFMK